MYAFVITTMRKLCRNDSAVNLVKLRRDKLPHHPIIHHNVWLYNSVALERIRTRFSLHHGRSISRTLGANESDSNLRF